MSLNIRCMDCDADFTAFGAKTVGTENKNLRKAKLLAPEYCPWCGSCHIKRDGKPLPRFMGRTKEAKSWEQQ